MVRCRAVASVTHPKYPHTVQELTTAGRIHPDRAKSPRPSQQEGPRQQARGPCECAVARSYGVTFPKSMNIVPAPSPSVNEYPNPPGHVAPPCEAGGYVWCQPDWITSQTVYVPAGSPVNV